MADRTRIAVADFVEREDSPSSEGGVKLTRMKHNMNWLSHPYRTFGKRLLDLCVSVPTLLAVVPLFVAIAAAIKLTSRGPVFFVQERLGRDGQTFRTFKFRTMTDRLRTAHQELFGKTDEITAVGFWLRRFKLDELPQLWNIVNGDMSLVGPRPALPAQLAEYTELARQRLLARPGLTGLAQVHGNIHLTWPERWIYDAEYVDRVSFALDVRIIVRTVAVVLLGEARFLKRPTPPDEQVARRAAWHAIGWHSLLQAVCRRHWKP